LYFVLKSTYVKETRLNGGGLLSGGRGAYNRNIIFVNRWMGLLPGGLKAGVGRGV